MLIFKVKNDVPVIKLNQNKKDSIPNNQFNQSLFCQHCNYDNGIQNQLNQLLSDSGQIHFRKCENKIDTFNRINTNKQVFFQDSLQSLNIPNQTNTNFPRFLFRNNYHILGLKKRKQSFQENLKLKQPSLLPCMKISQAQQFSRPCQQTNINKSQFFYTQNKSKKQKRNKSEIKEGLIIIDVDNNQTLSKMFVDK